jgi:serine/threonine protein kinase
MSSKIGRFEILSELVKSSSGCVYKASDSESGQTIALKTFDLAHYGEYAEELVRRIEAEAESTKDLSSPNITLVYGAGEIDGQFCAAMEYIQGNSIQTMLARKEGFSIWDLLDISRQVCQGLDHAHQHNVFHYSLEPSKIMVTWDGTVKILSFGISSTGFVTAVAAGEPPLPLYYMSPEQVGGEKVDARSNLFTWGAMLYEMVTDQKAFPGEDADSIRQKILEEMPAPPSSLNPKISPIASEVIMKALAKDPAQRYQSGREMVNDLECCREASKTVKKAPEVPKGPVIPDKMKAAAASKFANQSTPKASFPAPSVPPQAPKFDPSAENKFSSSSLSDELETSWTPAPAAKPAVKASAQPTENSVKKAAAAAAGWNSASAATTRAPQLDPSSQFVSAVVRASVDAIANPAANMSAAVVDEPEVEKPGVEKPKIAVDPMMAEGGPAAGKGVSFSDLDELPPLKEVYVAPPPPKTEETVDEGSAATVLRAREPEKPKVQPREVAEKAIKEIKGLPPQLMLYSVAGAIVLIAVIAIAVFWHSHSQNTDEEGSVPAPVAAKQAQEPAPSPAPAAAQPQASAPEPAQAAPQPELASEEPVAEERSPHRSAPAAAKTRGGKNKKTAPAPSLIPGQVVVDSTPEGAQVQVDGRGDPGWVTPYTLSNLAPGQHTIIISKSGFGQETRTTDVASGGKTSLSVHLNALAIMMAVTSDPPGAAIFVDSKDTLRVTPSQITLDKGTHTVLVRKAGYLDETTSATGQPGQTLKFSPTLRPLGNVDEIKTVGKFKKLFGGKGDQAGMAKVSVHTTPKGAQIAVNRRMVDKNSPVDFLLSPGNYLVDITMTGYKPVQKVITVDKGGTVSIDETLEPQQ